MKKRFTEEQIVRILQEAEGGMSTRDVCRKHSIAEQTFYRWKSKYGGMDVNEARRLRQLEEENRQLKHVVAELTLDVRALRGVLAKKL